MHFRPLSIRQKKRAFVNGAIWRVLYDSENVNTQITASFMLHTHDHSAQSIDLNIEKDEYGLILINILRIFLRQL